jgi:hypothetical protein
VGGATRDGVVNPRREAAKEPIPLVGVFRRRKGSDSKQCYINTMKRTFFCLRIGLAGCKTLS